MDVIFAPVSLLLLNYELTEAGEPCSALDVALGSFMTTRMKNVIHHFVRNVVVL